MPQIKRSITHWTAGGGRASPVDLRHYHGVTEFDGNFVKGKEEIEDNIVTSDGDYARHVLNLNTGSAGFALAGMRGATEVPFDPGPSPINHEQFEAHCKRLAEFHQAYGIPVTERTCLTHAEVEPTLGVPQRGKWDITRLPFKPELRGAIAVGNYMRKRVRAYMVQPTPEQTNRPILRQGDRGAFVLDAQVMLNGLGFHVGRADGIYGSNTKAGVLAFQDAAGLETDGIIGPVTWEALLKRRARREHRPVQVSDLRDRGSRTIATADRAEKAAKGGAAGVLGLGTVEVGLDLADRLAGASDTISAVNATVLGNWPVILLMGVGAVAYWYGPRLMESIRRYRVDDAQSGKHLGR